MATNLSAVRALEAGDLDDHSRTVGDTRLSPVMPFTGERFVPTEVGEIRYEHLHRYAICADVVRGKTVLDIASGEGYGAAILAQFARHVTGVDISGEAVTHAGRRYAKVDNLRFLEGSCTAIPLADESVEVVVSFETLEHIVEHDRMLDEVLRVLRHDGLMVISTPDRDVYTGEMGNRNEFHVRELDRKEFETLLAGRFQRVRIYGQRLATGSLVYETDHASATELVAYTESDEQVVRGVPPLSGPVYLIGVCGKTRRPLPILPTSLYLDEKTDLSRMHIDTARWANSLEEDLTKTQGYVRELQDEHERTVAWALELQQTATASAAELERTATASAAELERTAAASLADRIAAQTQFRALEVELVAARQWAVGLDAEIAGLRASTSWRVTAPLRALKLRARRVKAVGVRARAAVWIEFRRIFRSLPISARRKNSVRMWLFDHFHTHLSHLPFHAVWHGHRDAMRAGAMSVAVVVDPPELTVEEQRAQARALSLSTSTEPVVSVVIPVFGKLDYTLHCLRSIEKHGPTIPYEVIVVDDRSPDHTAEILSEVRGLRLLVNERNDGFIRSCNRGAAESRGRYVCFLNNDTEVTTGWLEELVQTFSSFAGVGLAGSKLLYPDGSLQEAGAILWNDGSAWNVGRGKDPSHPSFNYARNVDYCSGASLMVPLELFRSLGGFDEHYLPAYAEDSDLALKIRDRGLRVMYQPTSKVVHYEGITSGTSLESGVKAYQVENNRKLYARWAERLALHQAPGVDFDAAKDRGVQRRVLVLDHCTPTPDQDAGSITAMNLMLLLRQAGFQVTFIPEDNFLYMARYTPKLQRLGIEVLYAPHFMSVEQHLIESGSRYDLVVIFRPTNAVRNLDRVLAHCTRAKVIYHTSDVHFLRMSRQAEVTGDEVLGAQARKMFDVEHSIMSRVDAVIVHSTAERDMLAKSLPEVDIHVFQWAIPIRGTQSAFAQRSDIAFIGGYQHEPNGDAVKHFVGSVLPLIHERIPEMRFLIVGSKPTPEIHSLASDRVVVTGFVEDLGPLLDELRLAVAPLRFGAGNKGKICTTLSVGLPSVVSSIAAEGMELTDGESVLIADSPQDFADAVIRLYTDAALWSHISTTGLKFADEMYGPEAAKRCMAGILKSLDFDVDMSGPLMIYGPAGEPIASNDDQGIRTADADRDAPARVDRVNQRHLVEVPTTSSNGHALSDRPQVAGRSNDVYGRKLKEEIAIYAPQLKVHDLPSIFHYWSNKYLAPMFREAGFSSIEEFFAKNLQQTMARMERPFHRIVSIGSGNCDVEIQVARLLVDAGRTNFAIECLELNPAMLERGRQLADVRGVATHLRFVEVDFNRWKAEGEFSAAIANQSLHHVSDLEHLFAEVDRGLHRKGAFLVSDTIGRNGHLRWPEALDLVDQFWKELPESYRHNVLLNRHEASYENWDCSKEGFEGIRAEDILPLLLERFHTESFIGFGGAIDVFVDRCFGHHFDPVKSWDMNFIDRVHQADEAALRDGKLTPTHMVAVFRKERVDAPLISRGIAPEASVRRAEVI